MCAEKNRKITLKHLFSILTDIKFILSNRIGRAYQLLTFRADPPQTDPDKSKTHAVSYRATLSCPPDTK